MFDLLSACENSTSSNKSGKSSGSAQPQLQRSKNVVLQRTNSGSLLGSCLKIPSRTSFVGNDLTISIIIIYFNARVFVKVKPGTNPSLPPYATPLFGDLKGIRRVIFPYQLNLTANRALYKNRVKSGISPRQLIKCGFDNFE